jgi:hypothetical protein
MLRRLSVFAVAAALCLAGAGCTAAGYSGVARAVPPPVRTQAELAAALLRVEDLPSGYASEPAAAVPPNEGGQGGQGGGAAPCADVFDQLRGGEPALGRIASGSAEAEFSKGDVGPFLQQGLLSTGDRAGMRAAIEAFRQLPTLCGEFTENDEQGSFTIKLSAASLAPLGDETVAVKLDAHGKGADIDITLSGYIVMIREGATVCILIHFGIPAIDPAETETIARAAVARLG